MKLECQMRDTKILKRYKQNEEAKKEMERKDGAHRQSPSPPLLVLSIPTLVGSGFMFG